MHVHKPKVKIEEVTSVLTPALGVSLDQALADATLAGYEAIEIDREKNQAVIRWYKREKEE